MFPARNGKESGSSIASFFCVPLRSRLRATGRYYSMEPDVAYKVASRLREHVLFTLNFVGEGYTFANLFAFKIYYFEWRNISGEQAAYSNDGDVFFRPGLSWGTADSA